MHFRGAAEFDERRGGGSRSPGRLTPIQAVPPIDNFAGEVVEVPERTTCELPIWAISNRSAEVEVKTPPSLMVKSPVLLLHPIGCR